MLTRKPCKWCGDLWHSKNKCPNHENKPLKAIYKSNSAHVPLFTENASERPRLAYKGNSDRSQLIGYADKFFSLYIRTRGSDGYENRCYTCFRKLPVQDLQCGHFMARRYLNTRWNELNCWPQCNECNVEKHGNLVVYERLLRTQWGDAAIDGLKQLAYSTDKVTEESIKDIINQYKGVVF